MPKTRFTIYDAMDNAGIFSSNPANPGSRDNDGNALYTGPQEYPKMLYHPDGDERIVVQGEEVLKGQHWIKVGEQKELIHRVVQNKVEEDEAIASGWHDHPAKAVRARIESFINSNELSEKEEKALLDKIPKLSPSVNRVAELEAEIERLKAMRSAEADSNEEAA